MSSENTSFKFTDENLKRIEESVKKYPHSKAAVMDAVYVAQEQNGYITNEAMQEIANVLNIDTVDVYGVVTFYTMYFQKPMGKHHIMVCTNVSCMLRGAYEIYDSLKEKLGIDHMERTDDGQFSIEEAECLGACGYAPMMCVNEDFHENLTKEKVFEILDSLK